MSKRLEKTNISDDKSKSKSKTEKSKTEKSKTEKSKTEKTKKNKSVKFADNEKVMFILFPGHGNSEKDWNNLYDTVDKIDKKITFTSSLKKMGKICYVSFPWNNIFYYMDKDGKSRFSDDLNFYIEDYDVKAYCKKIFTEIKDFKGKFVPIGHSIGALFAHAFAEQYASRCAFSVTIDGSFLTGVWENQVKNISRYLKYTNDDLIELKLKVVKGNKNAINELSMISSSNILNSVYKSKKKYSNLKLKVKLISFFNIDVSNDPVIFELNGCKIKESIQMKKFNNNKYESTMFVDKSHWPHWSHDSRDIILSIIKTNIKNLVN